MGADLFHQLSTAELRREVQKLAAADQRSLPEKAKVFAAIAKLQSYDKCGEIVGAGELEVLLMEGCIELNRGLVATKAVPASVYFRDLLRGPMYPGTQIVYGQGIYFATPSLANDHPQFPLLSLVALRHTTSPDGGAGIIVRCGMRREARVLDMDDLLHLYRENQNRAAAAGISDAGSLAASLGLDAYYRDGAYLDTDERVWTVVNRTALVFQRDGLQIAPLL